LEKIPRYFSGKHPNVAGFRRIIKKRNGGQEKNARDPVGWQFRERPDRLTPYNKPEKERGFQGTVREKAACEPEKNNRNPKEHRDPQGCNASPEKTIRIDQERKVGQKHSRKKTLRQFHRLQDPLLFTVSTYALHKESQQVDTKKEREIYILRP
jgi:hypothetical protein